MLCCKIIWIDYCAWTTSFSNKYSSFSLLPLLSWNIKINADFFYHFVENMQMNLEYFAIDSQVFDTISDGWICTHNIEYLRWRDFLFLNCCVLSSFYCQHPWLFFLHLISNIYLYAHQNSEVYFKTIDGQLVKFVGLSFCSWKFNALFCGPFSFSLGHCWVTHFHWSLFYNVITL